MERATESLDLLDGKLVRPYLELKKENSDALLFFKTDDEYYEIFFDDAQVVSEMLGIPFADALLLDLLKVKMCIIPIKKAMPAIKKLNEKGFQVTVCER